MAVVSMIDKEATVESVENNHEKLLKRKTLLLTSFILTGFSGGMVMSSIVSLIRMQRVIDFFIEDKRHVPFALLGFRVVVCFLIIFAFVQLCINLPMMYLVSKEKVSVIYRVHSNFLISSSVLGVGFWLLVLSIFIYEIQLGTGTWLGFAVFGGGFIHIGLIVFFFMIVENQKRNPNGEESAVEEEETEHDNNYQKF